MKFQSDQQILNYKGEPIRTSEEDDTPVTLGNVLTMACVTADPQSHPSGEEKLSIYRILQKVSVEEGEIDITAEDITMLKILVGESYSVIIVGPVYDILEQVEEKPDDESESESGEESHEESDDSSSEVRRHS